MKRDVLTVPHGFSLPAEPKHRGTIVYYDSFENTTDAELELARAYAELRSFDRLVLYPLHEETVKRMFKGPVSAYYKREDRLHEWKRENGGGMVAVEGWEGKRKKYTPMEAALRHLTDVYSGPYFLYVSTETANAFASYHCFEEWIVKLRLVLSDQPERSLLHPQLEKFRHRIDHVGAEDK